MEADPSTTSTIGSALLNLIPVIIGGLLATVGAFAGAFLTYRLNQKESRYKVKREKLEQLANAAYRTLHWIEEHRNTNLFAESKDIGLSPISEVEYLSKLYFPELQTEVSNLLVASSGMTQDTIESRLFYLDAKHLPEDYLEKYKPLYEALIDSTTKLINKASVVAEKL